MQRHRHCQHKLNQMFFQIYVYICYSLIIIYIYYKENNAQINKSVPYKEYSHPTLSHTVRHTAH